MEKLMREHMTVAPISSHGGRVWVRLSAQIYNTRNDYLAFLDMIDEILEKRQFLTDASANVLVKTWVDPTVDHVIAQPDK